MSQTTQRAVRAARVTLLAAAAVAAGASQASAYSGGVSPLTTPILYPGTQTPVDGWKLAGTGSATNMLVAPRWVISSGHGAPQVGVTLTFPNGQSSKVVFMDNLYSKRKNKEFGASADISVALLENAITAPAGGFPQLLSDPITDDLKTTLPGWVMWAGHGGWSPPAEPITGWTKPDGSAAPGGTELRAIGGDSGSTGFLYKTPTSRPLMPGVTDYAQTVSYGGSARSPFGVDARFADVLAATATEPEITIKDWLNQQFAKYPTVTPPAFATFNDAGIPLSTLKPVTPAGLEVKSSTATSVTLGWRAQADSRVPLVGYRVSLPGRTFQFPPSMTTYTVNALAPKTSHTFTLKALNNAGVSSASRGRPETVSYRTRTVSPVSDLRVVGTRDREYSNGQVLTKYCVEASWLPATTDTGDAITGNEVRLNGTVVNTGTQGATDQTLQVRAGGRRSLFHCGLTPDTAYTVAVTPRSGASTGPATSAVGRTIAGVPAGTPLTAPRNVQSSVKRTITDGKVDYCMTTTWEAPLAVAGWPVDTYAVTAWDNTDPADRYNVIGEYTDAGLNPATRSHRVCGVEPGLAMRAEVTASYVGVVAALSTETTLTSPTGAPVGTTIQEPQNVTFTGKRYVTLQGKTDYCAAVAWQAPAVVAGFPVKSYEIVVNSAFTQVATVSGLSAGARSHVVCGLDPAKTYGTFLLARYDAAGDPPAVESGVVTPFGAPRGTTVPGPASPTIKAVMRNSNGEVDYCATATWQTPAAVTGFPVREYGVLIYDQVRGTVVTGVGALTPDRRSAVVCGLKPATAYHARPYASYGDNGMPVSSTSGAMTTPAGPPAGTAWPLPQAVKVVTSTENGQRCATVSWQAPAPLAGLPVLGYMAFFSAPGFIEYDSDMDAAARSYKACGLPAGRVSARVTALYPDRVSTFVDQAFDATTGALLA